MSLTIAAVEKVLIRRCGPMMVACDMSTNPTTDTSPRAYLADPILRALQACGFSTADYTDPADADVAVLSRKDEPALFDCAHYFLLETVAGNFIQVDYQDDSGGRKLNQFKADTLNLLEWKRKQLVAIYPTIQLGERGK